MTCLFLLEKYRQQFTKSRYFVLLSAIFRLSYNEQNVFRFIQLMVVFYFKERRDLEALKNKGKKSSKKRKSVASNTKKVEPFVEDAITKPCFGISRFSKTDPQGLRRATIIGKIIVA